MVVYGAAHKAHVEVLETRPLRMRLVNAYGQGLDVTSLDELDRLVIGLRGAVGDLFLAAPGAPE